MSLMFLAVGNPVLAFRNLRHGLTLFLVISNPAEVTVSYPNWNFSEWRVMPSHPHKSSQSTAWEKLLSKLSDHSSVFSIHLVMSDTLETISSKLRV